MEKKSYFLVLGNARAIFDAWTKRHEECDEINKAWVIAEFGEPLDRVYRGTRLAMSSRVTEAATRYVSICAAERTVFEALDRREAGLLIAHLNRWREKGDGLTDAEEREVDGWFPRPADKMGGEVSDGG